MRNVIDLQKALQDSIGCSRVGIANDSSWIRKGRFSTINVRDNRDPFGREAKFWLNLEEEKNDLSRDVENLCNTVYPHPYNKVE
jgi:hypothetical protein